MSREQLVREGYEGWNRRDFDEIIEIFDPAIDWRFYGGAQFPGTDEVYRGHEGVRRFWAAFIEPWSEIEIEIERLIETDDTVVVLCDFRAKGSESGVELRAPFTHVLRFEGDKVTDFSAYADRAAALRDAGLET